MDKRTHTQRKYHAILAGTLFGLLATLIGYLLAEVGEEIQTAIGVLLGLVAYSYSRLC